MPILFASGLSVFRYSPLATFVEFFFFESSSNFSIQVFLAADGQDGNGLQLLKVQDLPIGLPKIAGN